MAASLLACNPETAWYHFTYPFSWSSDCVVAQLLSDIPLISVGVLAFSVPPLFLAIRRISLSTIWLLFSAFLAFVAAVLDLGHTLADGVTLSMAIASSEPSLRAREVLLALSLGFRLLFYWSHVTEPPRKALSPASTQRFQTIGSLTVECTYGLNSGSWARWGFPGKLLGLGLLVTIMTITALQTVWRVVPRFHQYSNVYATDTALELLVSFLLLLKLLSNTLNFNSPNNMPVHTFRECLAPISGLLVNIAIGVGNLLSFAFTESTFGRLLQALEIGVVVVFVTVIALLRHCDILLSIFSPQRNKRKDAMFTLPEPARGSTFRITPPVIETPRMSMVFGSRSPNQQPIGGAFRRSARRSLNQVSSWLSSRVSRNRLRYEDDEAKLWNAEKLRVDPPYTGSIETELRASIVSLTREPKEWSEFAHDASTNRMSIISALEAQSAGVRSMEDAIRSVQALSLSPVDIPQGTNAIQARTSSVHVSPAPLPSASETRHAERTQVTLDASPVYRFGGSESLASPSDSRASLEELLKQQSQLDQSIEALRLFSSSSCPSKSAELSRIPSIGQRTVSSDVSLSSFPIPPWLTTPVPSLPSSRSSSVGCVRGGKRVRLAAAKPTFIQDTDAPASAKVSVPLADIPSSPRFDSIPNSPLVGEDESVPAEAGKLSSSDTGGIQYNVTSFIGGGLFNGSGDRISYVVKGLAAPGVASQESQEKSRCSIENGSNGSGNQIGAYTKQLPPRILPLPPRLEGLPASPAVAKRSPLAPTSLRNGS